MKTYLFAGLLGAGAMMFFGCANEASNPRTASNSDPGTRSYTGEELQNTGQAHAGAGLRRLDPDVDRTR